MAKLTIHEKYPWLKKLAEQRQKERKISPRRAAFLKDKAYRNELRVFCYKFGQPISISGGGDSYELVFETLHRGVKIEDVPTEFNGCKLKIDVLVTGSIKSWFCRLF